MELVETAQAIDAYACAVASGASLLEVVRPTDGDAPIAVEVVFYVKRPRPPRIRLYEFPVPSGAILVEIPETGPPGNRYYLHHDLLADSSPQMTGKV